MLCAKYGNQQTFSTASTIPSPQHRRQGASFVLICKECASMEGIRCSYLLLHISINGQIVIILKLKEKFLHENIKLTRDIAMVQTCNLEVVGPNLDYLIWGGSPYLRGEGRFSKLLSMPLFHHREYFML